MWLDCCKNDEQVDKPHAVLPRPRNYLVILHLRHVLLQGTDETDAYSFRLVCRKVGDGDVRQRYV